ncbi:dihydrodipicolinate synthase family protein [Streptomyces sp. ICBB 8177]|uniref:dihydrodipicolinate synthase family protein n=1 Tax=Streptomyces sp. ICBB 8177 TaxID=563922 RepID=UPI000D68532A|nr:dihydrodipicolinate synthase family protein [Streptomyces sp. ICBB 8177]PWI45804.1 4-hydroxy-tetrahydrodipicolinate synthase [Streptomyces sp. ICBB 8177]
MDSASAGPAAPDTDASTPVPRVTGGIHVPLVTPYAADGGVALDALEALAHEVLDAGAAGLVALGTTGEPSALDADERRAVTETVARICHERSAALTIGVSGGDGTRATAAALESLGHRWPHAAALVPVPSFTRPTQDGVVAHFRALTATAGVPLVVYNVPYRTGRHLGADALREIAALPRVAGVKQAVGALDADTVALLADPPPGFAVLAGDDVFAPALLALGAHGGILASAHLLTGRYVRLAEAWRDGDVRRARALGAGLSRVAGRLFAEPNPSVIKGVLHAEGRIPTAAVRLPLLPASGAAVEAARRETEIARAQWEAEG